MIMKLKPNMMSCITLTAWIKPVKLLRNMQMSTVNYLPLLIIMILILMFQSLQGQHHLIYLSRRIESKIFSGKWMIKGEAVYLVFLLWLQHSIMLIINAVKIEITKQNHNNWIYLNPVFKNSLRITSKN